MLDAEIGIEVIDRWHCENCLTKMELLSVEGKIFWCPECGTVSKGFPNSTWKMPKRVENGEGER